MSTTAGEQRRPRRGRPPVVTRERIIEAGLALTLDRLTVTAVAAELGVSTVGLYQHIDGIDGLRRMVADEIMRRRPVPEVTGDDLAADLLALSIDLRRFVHAHPGIGEFLARIDSTSVDGLAHIDATHARFADAYNLTPTQAAWLVSGVAEHAIALATVIHTAEPRPRRDREAILQRTDLRNLPHVAVRRPDRDDDWFYAWSMRATVIGMIQLVGRLEADLANDLGEPATPPR